MRDVVRETLSPEIRHSLTACWKEGIAAQLAVGVYDTYLIPYGLFLGATAQQIGFLVAVPNLLLSFSQLFAVAAVRWAGNRRNVLMHGVGLQAVFMIPVAALPFFVFPGKIPLLIVFVTVFRVLGSLVGPAWGSLVSDYLPEGQRGQYFGWRSRVVSLAGLFGIGFWGLLLYLLRRVSESLGFVVLFAGAALFRFICFYYLAKMADVPVARTPGSEFTLWMFLRRFRESNFVKFIFYVAGMTFATQVASPYFSVHMLENLHFSYISYTGISLVSLAAGLVAFPIWGRHSDIVGTARVIKTTSLMIPLIPLFWMFARRPAGLAAVEMFSGFVWSGFNLATTNFIFDAVSPAKRVRCLAYFNLINGAAVFLGAAFGGFLAERLPSLLGYPLISLFLVSAALRFAADFFLSQQFHEVRASAEKVSSGQLFLSVLGLRPISGQNVELGAFPLLRPPRKKWRGKQRPLPFAEEPPPG
ncbi:MAG: MFS transporter [Elusimicrobia bacterium]|nr:MFS transporter [Elusimicrobiota bacterium]